MAFNHLAFNYVLLYYINNTIRLFVEKVKCFHHFRGFWIASWVDDNFGFDDPIDDKWKLEMPLNW